MKKFPKFKNFDPRSFNVFVGCVIGFLSAAVVTLSPANTWLEGLSVDLLIAARHALEIDQAPPVRSPTAIIAIDEETYHRPPFVGLPKVAWTPLLGEALDAAMDHGASVIGQDLILPTSLDPLVPGHDRPYLKALARASRDGRIVLGTARHQGQRIEPHPVHRLLARGDSNIRLLNLLTDKDGVVRRAPLRFGNDEKTNTSFSTELVRRALNVAPLSQVTKDAIWERTLADGEREILLNFKGSPTGIPIYSLADIVSCARNGDKEFLEEAFHERIVLIGAVLDLEDRKMTSARYTGRKDGDDFAPRCFFSTSSEIYNETNGRQSIPGVLIHAQSINDIILDRQVKKLETSTSYSVIFLLCLLTSIAILLLSPVRLVLILASLSIIVPVISLLIFQNGYSFQWLSTETAMLFAAGGSSIFRFTVADRDQRHIRRTFSRYLSPVVVESLARTRNIPELGGETRIVTVWFSDLAGFTKISESMSPEELVENLNSYLSIVTDSIVAHGGMIDKYIGDAVVGIFGAPLDDPHHASHAVQAARVCQQRLIAHAERLNRQGRSWPSTRIGLNTGEALVGNIGSDWRLDYTAMGDTVNLASRLENLNKRYGTQVLMSGATAEHAEDQAVFLIERVRVVGRIEATEVFGLTDGRSESFLEAYDEARLALEGGDFESASVRFLAIAGDDPIAECMARYSAELMSKPPEFWTGAIELKTK